MKSKSYPSIEKKRKTYRANINNEIKNLHSEYKKMKNNEH